MGGALAVRAGLEAQGHAVLRLVRGQVVRGAEEQAAADETFRRVWESYKAFRDISFPYAAGNQLQYELNTFTRIGSAGMTA